LFRPPRDPVGARRYYLTSFTLMGAVVCLAGGAYLLDGETGKGIAGLVAGALVMVVAELMVRRAGR
jgi:hypothetical protein